ncbi:MAG TPA: hypothetical protein ENN72_05095 [Firmicutes bacterium]|nr:hypothetical protein [Bacillota bacterium]
MAQAFTPGLKVTQETIIKKKRILPLKGEVLVKEGDKVSYDQVVAKTDLPGNVIPINIANHLGVAANEVRECMLKKEGEKVEKGEKIALYTSFFGLFKNYSVSPITGTIENISDVTGQVLLREPPIPIEVRAYIDGIVTEIYPQEGCQVETMGAFIQGIFGLSGERSGEIAVVADSPKTELTADMIKPEHKGKILVGGSLIRLNAIKKAQQAGVSAVVVGGVDDKDLRALLGHDIGVAITGHEKIGFTLIATEGFGEMYMAQRTFELLKANEGKWASVNGATQIRAGVMRPEIIIPVDKSFDKNAAPDEEGRGLLVGDPIRIIREPLFGELGTITEMVPELHKMESETMVRVFRVKLSNGEERIVPRANVERIEVK